MESKNILLAHGSGGKLTHDLITKSIYPAIANPVLAKMNDAAEVDFNGRLAFTTDSFVVQPIFFPGGDIGKLAICGTINDLSMMGARPLYLSLSFIIEEGLPIDDLERVMESIRKVTCETGIQIITGDTKVVNHGSADKLFINTSGIGIIPPEVRITGADARPGDKIILNGSIGEHGIAVMAQRAGLRFKVPVISDCAPLNTLTVDMLRYPQAIHCMRDPTRGGLATTLNEIASRSQVGFRIFEDKIPIQESVRSACEMLGIDPLYVANEGKLIAFVSPEMADQITDIMRLNQYGKESVIIGEVEAANPGRVVMQTKLGASRIISMLSGEILPRIC